jgi:predicted RNA-binding protein (virulence factor B family)
MVTERIEINTSLFLKSTDTAFVLLHHIIEQMPYPGGLWYGDKLNKDKLLDVMDISEASLNRLIGALKKKEILMRIEKAKYTLNKSLILS